MAIDLRKLIETLAGASVDFVVVGGVAVVAHGHVRATIDLDVCYLELLERAKRAAGRAKDLLDLEAHRELRRRR